MNTRELGRSGLTVSAIGFGCMSTTGAYDSPSPDRDAMIALVRQAVDEGVTFFDTAEAYGPHTNEQLVGDAGDHEATPAQVALAWLIGREPWIVPIPGTTKPHRLTENNGAARLQLGDDEMEELNGAAAAIGIAGDRFPDALEAATNL